MEPKPIAEVMKSPEDLLRAQSHGSMPTAGSGTTHRLSPEVALDTIRQAHSRSLWRIKPDAREREADNLVLQALLIRATYDEACMWIGRMLQHFPARQTDKDAVIVSDLAGDCLESGVSLCAVIAACDDVRRAATADNPFLPPTGDLLRRMKEKTEEWAMYLKRNKTPEKQLPTAKEWKKEVKPDTVPWFGLMWREFTEAHRRSLDAHLATMKPEDARAYRMYLHHHAGAPRPEDAA